MKQTIEIEVPDGKVAVWKNGELIIEDDFNYRYKTWEEYALRRMCGFFYINGDREISYVSFGEFIPKYQLAKAAGRFIFSNRRQAEQHLALMKLHELRDEYRATEGCFPYDDDMFKKGIKFRVCRKSGDYGVFDYTGKNGFLTFLNRETAEEFLKNFRDLIEQAGDLI